MKQSVDVPGPADYDKDTLSSFKPKSAKLAPKSARNEECLS